jgi:hypothetical protein
MGEPSNEASMRMSIRLNYIAPLRVPGAAAAPTACAAHQPRYLDSANSSLCQTPGNVYSAGT